METNLILLVIGILLVYMSYEINVILDSIINIQEYIIERDDINED